MVAPGLVVGVSARVYLQNHVLTQFFVYREHLRVVRVKAVHHGVKLDAFYPVFAKAAHLTGFVFQTGMQCAEGDKHVVLDGDEPVVSPFYLIRSVHDA